MCVSYQWKLHAATCTIVSDTKEVSMPTSIFSFLNDGKTLVLLHYLAFALDTSQDSPYYEWVFL